MSEQLTLEERHRLLKEVLRENLERKRFIEMNIGEQFEGLKKLEILLEKMRASRENQMSNSRSDLLWRSFLKYGEWSKKLQNLLGIRGSVT